jgi:hypothetical protein
MALTRCRFTFFVTLSLGLLFSFDPVRAVAKEPLLINQIAIDPHDPRILYAAARPQGVLKSTDRGMTWHPSRQGLTNTSTYYIVINPTNPKILYLGTFGGGIYKSEDAGGHWAEANAGLNNTNIHALVLNQFQPDQLVVATSTGELFQSENAGKIWIPFNDGLPFFPGEIIATLLVFGNNLGGFYLAQGELFRRPFASLAWHAVDSGLREQVITALAYDQHSGTLYAGTMKEGLFKTNVGPTPLSVQQPLSWTAMAGPFQKQWVRLIVLDPSDPSISYVGIINQGLFKSSDYGTSWTEISTGLPTREVESVAVDPTDSKVLYVGTHNDGLFLSRDGGVTWTPPERFEIEPVQQIVASLSSPPLSGPSRAPRVGPPPAFAKCNKCHGWTDAALNQKTTYWRVTPNLRNWRPTVHRMSQGAGLTSQEEDELVTFLTEYSTGRHAVR